jgi:hypothetical protein
MHWVVAVWYPWYVKLGSNTSLLCGSPLAMYVSTGFAQNRLPIYTEPSQAEYDECGSSQSGGWVSVSAYLSVNIVPFAVFLGRVRRATPANSCVVGHPSVCVDGSTSESVSCLVCLARSYLDSAPRVMCSVTWPKS